MNRVQHFDGASRVNFRKGGSGASYNKRGGHVFFGGL